MLASTPGGTGGSGGTGGAGAAGGAGGAGAGDETGGSGGEPSTGGAGGGTEDLSVEVYESDPGFFALDSYLIAGPTEAVLVDGQFFRADAEAVVDLVNDSGKTLKTVFVTHAHPDHYLGLQTIRDAFPNAELVTTPDVLADYNQRAQGTLDGLKPQLGDAIADEIVELSAVSGTSLEVDGVALDIVEIGGGEAPHTATLSIPSHGLYFAGDVLYKDTHLVLSECDSEGWKANIEQLRRLDVATFYPGHGAPSDDSILDENVAYIDTVIPILEASETPEAAKATILVEYPDLAGSGLLDFSVQNYFLYCKPQQ